MSFKITFINSIMTTSSQNACSIVKNDKTQTAKQPFAAQFCKDDEPKQVKLPPMHNVSKPQGTMYSDIQIQTDNVHIPSVQQANMAKEDKLDSAEAVLLNQMLLQKLPSMYCPQ